MLQKFLQTTDSTNATVKKLISFVAQRKDYQSFAKQVINESGLPLWDKALMIKKSAKLSAKGSSAAADTNYVFVPLVPDGKQEVEGVFACKTVGDSVKVNYLSEKEYERFGFDASNAINATDFISLLMYLENSVFGTQSFVIHDERIFPNFKTAATTSQKKILTVRNKKQSNDQNKISGRPLISAYYVTVQICVDVIGSGCRNPSHYGQMCGDLNNTGYYTIEKCTDFVAWVDEGSGSGGGSTGGGTGGSGGTGSVSGSGSNGGNGGTTAVSSTISYLSQTLNLLTDQLLFLNPYPNLCEEMYNYLNTSDGDLTVEERNNLAKSHILYLSQNSSYLSYCNQLNEDRFSFKGFPLPWFQFDMLRFDNPELYANIQNLKLDAKQAYYLENNANHNISLSQFLLSSSNDEIYKLLGKEFLNDAVLGKPFNLPIIWVNHTSTNNVNRIIVNLLQNKCLEQVFNTITKESYTNKLSEMIREFDIDENITIVVREDNILGSDKYGECKGILDDQNNVKFYLISLNPTALSGVSEEFIGDTFFHEFIHGYLKSHLGSFDFENISDHTQMLASYLDKMAAALSSIFGTNLVDSYCIAYSGLLSNNDSDPVLGQILSAQVKQLVRQKLLLRFQNVVFQDDDSIIQRANDYDKNGSKGKRTGNCQ